MTQHILTAHQRLDWLRQRGQAPTIRPKTVILCFHIPLLRWATKGRKARKVRGFYGETYSLRGADDVVVVGNFGIGAPVTAILTEDWAAQGATNIISLGVAGSLSSTYATGESLLVKAAIGSDGTSQRYVATVQTHCASKKLVSQLQSAEVERTVTSWTCDTPYRESWQEVQTHLANGVAVVEMEIAALYAVAQALSIHAAAVVVIADSLGEGGWMLAPEWHKVETGLQHAFLSIVEALR